MCVCVCVRVCVYPPIYTSLPMCMCVCVCVCARIPSNLHLSANSRGLCIVQRISFMILLSYLEEGLQWNPCQRQARRI